MNKHFELSAAEAGKRCGVSGTTFIKFSELYPEELPRLEITPDKKTIIRFSAEDVRRFITQRVANTEINNSWTSALRHHLLDDAVKVFRHLGKGEAEIKRFYLLMISFLNVFDVAARPPFRFAAMQQKLADLEPYLLQELAGVLGADGKAFTDYLSHQVLEYLLEWGLMEASDNDIEHINKMVWAYKLKVFYPGHH